METLFCGQPVITGRGLGSRNDNVGRSLLWSGRWFLRCSKDTNGSIIPRAHSSPYQSSILSIYILMAVPILITTTVPIHVDISVTISIVVFVQAITRNNNSLKRVVTMAASSSLAAPLFVIYIMTTHDDVIKRKHFRSYWPFVRSPVNSPHKGQWRQLSKQTGGWWYEMLSSPLWRHCYAQVDRWSAVFFLHFWKRESLLKFAYDFRWFNAETYLQNTQVAFLVSFALNHRFVICHRVNMTLYCVSMIAAYALLFRVASSGQILPYMWMSPNMHIIIYILGL